MTKDTTISLRITQELRDQLANLAQAECRTISAQALHLIKQGLDKPTIKKAVKQVMDRPFDVSPQTWLDYLEIRKAKKLPVTQTAIDEIRRQADIAGLSLNSALLECCSRGWAGFKAEWVGSKQNAVEQANRRAAEEFING